MEKRSVGRPKDGNPGETRKDILRAAEESFAQAGFSGASTRQVASRAGVNVATLHYHFGSKRGLYQAVLSRAMAPDLPPAASGTPAERLTRLVESLWDLSSNQPGLPRLALHDMLNAPPAEGEEPVVDERVLKLQQLLESLNGSLRPALPPPAAARTIVSLLDATALAAGKDLNGREKALRSSAVGAALKMAGVV